MESEFNHPLFGGEGERQHSKEPYQARKAKSQFDFGGKKKYDQRKAESHKQMKDLFEGDHDHIEKQITHEVEHHHHQTKDSFDPFNDSDFKMLGAVDNIDKEMGMVLAEEKAGSEVPLNLVEVKKLEQNGKTLLDEITSGLKSYGKEKFWRKKKFFVDHNGF